jgi:hypothetical protein
LKTETKGKEKTCLALMQGKSLAFFGELWKGSRNKAVKNAQAIRFK